jgi:hypothetical protein
MVASSLSVIRPPGRARWCGSEQIRHQATSAFGNELHDFEHERRGLSQSLVCPTVAQFAVSGQDTLSALNRSSR